MPNSTDDFFEEPLEQSRVKARIVKDYVVTFGRILSDYQRSKNRAPHVVYVDLFSGPGQYEDGTASTPLMIMRSAVKDPKLAPALQTFFNDSDPIKASALKRELSLLPGLQELAYQPVVLNEQASPDLVENLRLQSDVPKLFFLDPFGYKPLTMPLLRIALEGWAECIFFFNYRRVIGAINNPVLDVHARRMFGSSRLEALQTELLKHDDVRLRERIVLKALSEALIEAGAKHVLNFAFKVEDEHRSTHHLIFATRHRSGYEAMKNIMASQSSWHGQDGPSMTFLQRLPEPTLFDRDPHDVLADDLLRRFASQTLSFDQLYTDYGLETSYTQPYFRKALLNLEEEGRITTEPPAMVRPRSMGRPTMAGNTRLIFPEIKQ